MPRLVAARELSEMRLVIVFACAQFIDLATTVIGLRSGRFREGNPVASGFLAHSGKLSFSLKLVVGFLVLVVLHRFLSARRRLPVLMLLTAIALAAPAANAFQLLRTT
jgi:hypothetical protein